MIFYLYNTSYINFINYYYEYTIKLNDTYNDDDYDEDGHCGSLKNN